VDRYPRLKLARLALVTQKVRSTASSLRSAARPNQLPGSDRTSRDLLHLSHIVLILPSEACSYRGNNGKVPVRTSSGG
jgi:hypothetical protein